MKIARSMMFALVLTPTLLLSMVACDGGTAPVEPPMAGNPEGPHPEGPVIPIPDQDADGIPDDRDLCPATATAEATTADGCGVSQTDATGNPLPGMSTGFETFAIDAGGISPVVFRARTEWVKRTATGFSVEGTLLLSTPVGQIALLEASVELESVAGDPMQIDRIRGLVRVPMPEIGFLSGFDTPDPLRAEIGLDYGKNLEHLGAPLAAERRYVFFSYTQGLSASAGPITISAPGAADALLIVDPADPMIYVEGSLFGMGAIGPLEDVGIGMSLQGLMPFTPLHTLEGRDDIGVFDGHLYVTGKVPFVRLPLALDGEMMIDLGGEPDLASTDLHFGANGILEVSVDFLKFFHFGFELGSATAVARIAAEDAYAYVSGTLAPDTSWLPSWIPLVPDAEVHVEALLSADLAESYISAEGSYGLGLGSIAERLGLDLTELIAIDAAIDINREDGVWLRGTTSQRFSPLVSYSNEVTVEARFRDIDDWFINLTGALEIGGIQLSGDAVATISPNGVHIAGTIALGRSHIAVSGELTRDGLRLHGETRIVIDVVAGKEVVETIVDGAVCGYAIVTNGAICGYEVVTSGAICGWDLVTSAAKCGYETITSAARCGVETIGCWILPWKWGTCEEPKSCQVAASCEVPKTCTDWDAPKTCTDWSQPLECDQIVTIPDFDFGDFVGTVSLTLDSREGLSGSVYGEYCPNDGACVTIAGGRVVIGEHIEACVSLPGDIGEVCASL